MARNFRCPINNPTLEMCNNNLATLIVQAAHRDKIATWSINAVKPCPAGSGRTEDFNKICIIYPNFEFPTGLKMENNSLQRAFCAGSGDERLFPRHQSLGEDGSWNATCV